MEIRLTKSVFPCRPSNICLCVTKYDVQTCRLPAAAAAAPAAAEQTEFDVVLTGFGDKKLDVVKVVKNLTGASLMDAKKLVEGVPAKIKEKVSKEDAAKVKAELEAAGAQVEVK